MKDHSTSPHAPVSPLVSSSKPLKIQLILMVAFGLLLALPGRLQAQTQYGSGSFTWDNGTTASWGSAMGGPYTSVWTAGNDAVLEGASGAITLNNPTVHNMKITVSGFTLSGASTLTLGGTMPTVFMTAGGLAPMNTLTTFGNNTAAVLDGSSGLTLLGNGTFLLNPSVVSTFTGGVNLNGGDLMLNFANLATPTDLINSGNALNFGGGRLLVTGKSAGSTSQSFAGTTLSPGGGTVLVNPNGGTDTTVNLGSLNASATGGGLLVGRSSGAGSGTATITTTTSTNAVGNIYGARVLYTTNGGAAVDWATTTSGSAPYALSAYSGYTTLPLAGATDTLNSRLVLTTNTTLTGAHTHNSLKIECTAAAALTMTVGDSLKLESGGLLLQGSQRIQLSGGPITAGADSGYNLTINNHCLNGPIMLAAVVDNGVNPVSVTYNAPTNTAYTLFWNNTASTYSGNTYVNGGLFGLNASGLVVKSPVIYVRPGAQVQFVAGSQTTNTFNIAGYGASQASSANGQLGALRMVSTTLTGPVVLSGDARIGALQALTPTISGPISGDFGIDFYGSLNANGETRFTLSNTNNSFSGNATVSCQNYSPSRVGSTILRLGASEVLPNGPGKGMLGLLGPDADHLTRLDLNGNTETINGLYAATASAFVENNLASTVGRLIIGDANTSSKYSGGIRNNAGTGGTVAITKIGSGTLTLSGTCTHTGDTTISAGTLALGTGGVINASAIRIGQGATFDVSAQSAFTLGGSASLRASGTNGAPATMKGGTSIDLGSQSLILDYSPASTSGDLTNPALTISQGNLTLGSPITINIGGSTPLGVGTYTIISSLSGTISGSPSLLITTGAGPAGTGLGAGMIATLDMSTPGQVRMVVASTSNNISLTRTVGNSPSALGATLNFRATLTPAPVDGTTVTFFTNNVLLGTANTVGGIADYTTSTLPYSGGVPYNVVALAPGYSADFLVGGQEVKYASWINLLGGIWDTAGNWLDSIIADGTGNTADFNSLDITNNVTVSLNGPRNIGVMLFGDTNSASAGGWTLNNNGNAANILTMAGPAPAISVGDLGGSNVTISAEIAGTVPLSKTGPGTLVLSGVNTFSTNVTVSEGTLVVTGGSAIPDTTYVTLGGTGILRVAASETVAGLPSGGGNNATGLELDSGTVLTVTAQSSFGGTITGLGGLTYSGPNTSTFTLSNTNSTHGGITKVTSGRIQINAISPNAPLVAEGTFSLSDGQLFLGATGIILSNNCTISGHGFPDSSGLNSLGAIRPQNNCVLAGTITLADQARIGVVNSVGVIVSGKITGGYGINFYAANNANVFDHDITIANTGNDYTGDTTIDNVDYGSTPRTGCSTMLKLGASEVIPHGAGKGNVLLNGADANHRTILDLNGFNETINGVSGSAGAAVIRNTAPGTSILTLGGADASSSFDGNVTDGGVNSGKYLAIAKIGTGTVSLGANSYKGNTTANGGTLVLTQPTLSTSSTVTITNGASLQLSFAGGETNTVAGLVLNGVSQPAGLYDSSTPGGYLAGSTGKLLVVPPPSINPNPPVLEMSYSGGNLNLAWPTNQGWILQSNSVSLTATNSWFNYPADGSVGVTNVSIPVSPSEDSVFFRMKKP